MKEDTQPIANRTIPRCRLARGHFHAGHVLISRVNAPHMSAIRKFGLTVPMQAHFRVT